MPARTLKVQGSYEGLTFEYIEVFSPEDDEPALGETIAWLKQQGAEALVATAPAPVTQVAPAAAAGGPWVCPIHGSQKLGEYRGRKECKVTVGEQPEWEARSWPGDNGTMYSCSKKEPKKD